MSRRAVGTLLKRAARGAGLTAEEWRVASCSSVCSAGVATSGGPDADIGPQPSRARHGSSPAAPVALLRPHPHSTTQQGQQASHCLSALGAAARANAASTSAPASAFGAPGRRGALHAGSTARRFSTFAAAASDPSGTEPGATSSAPSSLSEDAAGSATHGSSPEAGGTSAELLMRRGQLLDSLAACLGIHQLDSLLANERNLAAFDGMLLVTALDTAHRLCSNAASAAVQLDGGAVFPSSFSGGGGGGSGHKSTAEAATDVLTALSGLLIQLLSEPGALSTESAVRAIRTLAVLRFNPAGDNSGLMTMSSFYRESVLPALDPARSPPPELALRAPLLLADVYFAFSRLFEVAARRDREIQAQLLAEAAREEEAAARAAADEEGSGGAAAAAPSSRPYPSAAAVAAARWGVAGGAGASAVVVGDVKLYDELSRMLLSYGMQSLPSKALGMLATAVATSRHLTNYHLVNELARQTQRRLWPAAAAPAAGGDGSALPTAGGDVMAPSTLSNIVSCVAKVRYDDGGLYDSTANWILARTQPGGGGGVEPHHLVDLAVAFARVKYDNMDYLLRASGLLTARLASASPNTVSMMAWALANTPSGKSSRFEPLLSALCSRMSTLLQQRSRRAGGGAAAASAAAAGSSSASSGASVLPRHLACIAYAVSRMEARPAALWPLLDGIAADVEARAEEYQARQLCNVLVAFTRLGSYRPGLFAAACAVLRGRLEALAPYSAADLAAAPPRASHVFGPQNYADVAWAVAIGGHGEEERELMALLADRVAETAGSLGKACLVRAAQAFAVANVTDPKLFAALAQASQNQVMEMGPPYQAMLLDAFAEVQAPVTEEFWLACMDAVGIKVPHMQLRSDRPDMQSAAAQLAAAFARHPASREYERCRQHSVQALLEELVAEADARAEAQQ